MKQLSIILMVFISYSIVLLSCVGVSPTPDSIKESPITMQDNGITSPLQADVVATSKPTSAIDTSCNSYLYEAWENDKTGESGTGKEICEDKPTPVIKKRSPEKQAAVATALAYLGDKAPYVTVASVEDRSVPGYVVRFKQVYQNIPVEDGRITVVVEPDKSPWISNLNRYYKGVNISNTTPALSLEEAIDIGLKNLDITERYKIETEFNKLQIITVPTKKLINPENNKPAEDSPQKYVLAWFTILTLKCPAGDWNIWVEANTGDVLRFANGERWDPGPPPTPNCPIRFKPPTAAPPPTP